MQPTPPPPHTTTVRPRGCLGCVLCALCSVSVFPYITGFPYGSYVAVIGVGDKEKNRQKKTSRFFGFLFFWQPKAEGKVGFQSGKPFQKTPEGAGFGVRFTTLGEGVAPRQKERLRHQGEEGSEKKHEEGDTRNRHMTKRKDRENRKTAIFNGKAKTMKTKVKGVRAER